ncbi:MAG: NAD-dependent epimerase/dehydratase [Frondihabitans sp.]|nr:NAD-dependent epimerase/dehydratase [Frondihabitans sp.]
MTGPGDTWVVLGGTGFLGSHVAQEAVAAGHDVTRVQRQAPAADPDSSAVSADIRHAGDLDSIVDGAHVVVHAASYVGRDEETAHSVNVEGTSLVVRAVARAATPRLIYLSTASVTGRGPHRNAVCKDGDQDPESAVSRSRALAERIVLEAGGIVLRPNLVYGQGDRWFVPALATLLQGQSLPAGVGEARISTVHVEALARAVVAVGADLGRFPGPGTYYVTSPAPDSVNDVLTQVESLGANRSGSSVTATNAWNALSAHQQSLLTVDNYFDSSPLWDRLPIRPARNFHLSDRDRLWYKKHLTSTN